MKGKENCFPSEREGSHNFSSNLPHRVCNLRARFEEMLNVGKLVTRIRETNVLIIRKNCIVFYEVLLQREKCRLKQFCYFCGLCYLEDRFRTSFVDAGFPIATSLVRGP